MQQTPKQIQTMLIIATMSYYRRRMHCLSLKSKKCSWRKMKRMKHPPESMRSHFHRALWAV
eukprot:5587738-Prymnesium_polylepis.1